MATLTHHEQPIPAPPVAPVLQFEHVGMAFGREQVLEDISFQVNRGETKILLGETNTGKTVLLKLALGLLRPTRGRIFVMGQEVSVLPEEVLFDLRRQIGIVFQESALFDSMTVRENVAYRLVEEGEMDDRQIEERVRTCLSFVELESTIDKMPDELSGGMRRRVSIARALAAQPEIMLYDSPTGGLDPVTATTIMELIIKLRDVNKVTSLLVTHRLQDAYLMATHVWDTGERRLRPAPSSQTHTTFLMLRDRRIIFDGSVGELQTQSDPYIKNYLS